MKHRITLTIDPDVSRRAKRLARARKTSVSGLVEQLLRAAPLPGGEKQASFASTWAGKFKAASGAAGDARLNALKKKFNLD